MTLDGIIAYIYSGPRFTCLIFTLIKTLPHSKFLMCLFMFLGEIVVKVIMKKCVYRVYTIIIQQTLGIRKFFG